VLVTCVSIIPPALRMGGHFVTVPDLLLLERYAVGIPGEYFSWCVPSYFFYALAFECQDNALQ
jgi:hypothetical protein